VQHVKNGRSATWPTFKRSKIPRTSEKTANVQATNLKLKSALFILSISIYQKSLPTLGSTGIHNMSENLHVNHAILDHSGTCETERSERKFQASGLSAAKEASAPVPKPATTIQGPIMSQVLMSNVILI
jgi:hypothetical protein